ncbi:MAG: hypothetical protein QG642_283, partial [Patescibacteria group bacterium]|nr:hypothetical protein [Patescibacteria group bacterium]
LCPAPIDNVCILFWNGAPVTGQYGPADLEKILNRM